MKYKYRKSFIVLWLIAMSLIPVGFYCLFFIFNYHPPLIANLGFFALFVFACLSTIYEFKNKEVELKENLICFYSFKQHKRNKVFCNLYVEYNHVNKIKVRRLPIIGISSVSIYLNDKKIYLPKGFFNEKQLIQSLISRVKSANPNVPIEGWIETTEI